jgi:tetratricopeptide (TPR) repeat protein
MSSRRPVLVIGTLFVLLGNAHRAHSEPQVENGNPALPAELAPLPGTNALSGLAVSQGRGGEWTADFDYFFTGRPRTAAFQIELITQPGSPKGSRAFQRYYTLVPRPERGAHHVSVPIAYPGSEGTSRQVLVTMLAASYLETVIASQRIDQVIDWPDEAAWVRDQRSALGSPEANFNRAVALIDSNGESQLREARVILEKLIGQNAKFDSAYVELARIAMKSNWGPEGLHQAENLLGSAMQIRPDSVNAKVLLGYVYSHQNRFTQAEALFADAARSDTDNLWLWANWGELLVMQGKLDQAIAKYREAITRPMTHDTYDRARADAYVHLLVLLEQRQDLDGMEALYKQRVDEFGPGSCYSAGYARFMLNVRGDTQGAIDLARRALNQNCEDSESRQILGLAQYVKWAGSSGADSAEALNQARIYLPAGPMAFYHLATSDRTVPAARKLVATGEPIDQKDNDKQTALAYALQNRDIAAAKRLLTLGARPDTPVGYGDVPLALLPVMEGDLESIRMLQRSGVDYSKLRYQGATAFDFAKQTGNSALLEVLAHKDLAL